MRNRQHFSSLAAALALPEEFPGRDFILATTFAVILVTVLVQGATLAPLIRALGIANLTRQYTQQEPSTLSEAEARVKQRHSIWTRIENDDRTTDLLGAAAPPEETVIGRVQAYTGGYAHRIGPHGWSALELGAQFTVYDTPPRLLAFYGSHPVGVAAVLHWRVGQ